MGKYFSWVSISACCITRNNVLLPFFPMISAAGHPYWSIIARTFIILTESFSRIICQHSFNSFEPEPYASQCLSVVNEIAGHQNKLNPAVFPNPGQHKSCKQTGLNCK
jgi:hypothetical protein